VIQCARCKAKNPSDGKLCKRCATALLSQPSAVEQKDQLIPAIVALLFGLVGLVFGALLITKIIPTPYMDPGSKLYWIRGALLLLLGIIAMPIGIVSLVRVISPAPADKRYFYRAKRHIGIDNNQAEEDFNNAIRLSHSNSLYYFQRGLFYEKTGRFESARADFKSALENTSDKDSKRLYEAAYKRIGNTQK
jgi:tetratricopeptide (TPR) repeat protein